MPNDNRNSKKINDLLNYLDKQTSDLHRMTYFSTDTSDNIYDNVTTDLDDAIRKATDGDDEFKNLSNVTKLLQKVVDKPSFNGADTKLVKGFGKDNDNDISTLFQSSDMVASLMETYAKTKWVSELDSEFDIICKYMPKLQTALDLLRDVVLCSDSYSKQFLNIVPANQTPGSESNSAVQNNIKEMVKKYDLENKTEQWLDHISKYGEEFIYLVPYNLAFSELLKRKANTSSYSLSENVNLTLKDILPMELQKQKVVASVINENSFPTIKLTFNHSNMIDEVIQNNYDLRKSIKDPKLMSISEMYITETGDSFEDHIHKSGKNDLEIKFDRTIDDEIKWEDDDKSASDGLVSDKEDTKTKVNGAVLKSIRHDRTIPIYIEDMFFGVYYLDNDWENEAIDINANSNVNGYNSITTMFNNGTLSDAEKVNGDQILKTIAGKIAQQIDAAFINANSDLADEIYLLLKYNDKYNQIDKSISMNVTFIPADDIHHLKFREDPDTHRGISDLWDSLVSAKQWIMLNITSILGWTTRGFDRRVYYVKQSLDTNTAQSLLNVISTIKKGNFGIRQIESINNILNILGRFNDFVIPMGPSGDPPIQFDTMPGQQFDFPQELMQNLEESAVNATGVPIEIVNSSTGMDFAVRYTMTNAKLLRMVLKRQLIYENALSEIFTKLYKFEYNENIELTVILPPPAFLSMTQGTQLIQSAVQYAEQMAEVEMANEEDKAKNMFKQRLIRKLIPTYISDDEIQSIKDSIKIDNSIDKSEVNQDEGY